MNDANYAYLEECGLSRLSHAESLPSVMHDDFNRWLAHLRADIAINVGFPSPSEPHPVSRAIALWEKHRKKPQSAAEILADQNTFRAQEVRNRICSALPSIKACHWSDDERELFGLEKDDVLLPREGASLYELEQQLARILNGITRSYQRVRFNPARDIDRFVADRPLRQMRYAIDR